MFIARSWFNCILYPPLHQRGKGVYWIHPDICLSVCRQGFCNFLQETTTKSKVFAQCISYLVHVFILRGESLDPYSFSCSFHQFWASRGQIFGRKWGFWRTFLEYCSSNSFDIWHLTQFGWVSGSLFIFVFLSSIYALWWPNIWSISWIFLEKLGSDHSGGILFPFMATACLFCFAKLLLMLLQDSAQNDDNNNLMDLVSSINDNLSVSRLI